ncbi:MAG: amidohydrolase family protein [Pirellulaceae bacterium]|nr:amidohydrolase family protein [Pirellulaceae bacterium]
MPIDRRQFFAAAGSAAIAGLVTGQLPVLAAEKTAVNVGEIPIIDCHQHLWDLDRFKLPWIEPGTLLGKSYVMRDYLAAREGTGIRHAVYMEVDVDPSQQQAEADHLIEICKTESSPTIAAVVSGRPASDGFAAYARGFRGSPQIKGIRQVLHVSTAPQGYCLGEGFVRGMKLLGELGLSFDLCMRPADLADGAKLAEKCPDTRFILDHCGNADPKAFLKSSDPRLAGVKPDHAVDAWKRDLEKVASRPNVLCKISGIVARVPKEWSPDDLAPIVNHCLDTFGPQRVLFGSDWPVCLLGAPLAAWVSALRQIIASRPALEQKQLLWDNAAKFYGLKV